jgi:long-chain fatty acid transport protein
MKRWAMAAAFAVIAFMAAGDLFAGSIDYLSNQSADYIRTFSRNASTDADATVYNPAGTAFMKPGIYAHLSNQTLFKKYSDTLDLSSPTTAYNKKYGSNKRTWVLPNGSVIYKADKWAAFLGLGVTGGGGKVQFDDGIPIFALYAFQVAGQGLGALFGNYTGNGKLTATSLYPHVTVGGSYAINDMISASLGLRYIQATKTYKGYAEYTIAGRLNLDAKEKAKGIGGIIGIDVRPIEGLNIGARYETQTKLDFKTSASTGDDMSWHAGPTLVQSFFIDGEKRRKDLPAMLALGGSYTFNQFTVTASWECFFIGQADQKKDTTNFYTDGYDDDYASIGWESGLSFEYAAIPDFLKLSVGYLYCKVGGNSDTYNDFDYSLDSQSFGLGGRIVPTKDLNVVLGLSRTFYKDGKAKYNNAPLIGKTTYKKAITTIALGAEYKI